MKAFKVRLDFGSTAFVRADSHRQVEHLTKFYKDGEVVAEYATAAICRIEETFTAKVPWLDAGPEEKERQ